MASRSVPKFVIEEGPTPGKEVELKKLDFCIGRETGLDLVIASPSISRRHCRFLSNGDQVILEDLGSSNGTFVNGVRLSTPTPLQPDDVIQLGQAVRLRYLGPPAAQKTQPIGETEADGKTALDPPSPAKTIAFPETPPSTYIPPAPQTPLIPQTPQIPPSQPPPQASPAIQTPPAPQPPPVPQRPQAPQSPPAPRTSPVYQSPPVPKTQIASPMQQRPPAFTPPPAAVQRQQPMSPGYYAGGPPPEVSETAIGQEQGLDRMPYLVVTIAGSQPQTYRLYGERITLGRADDNDLQIPFKIISNHHAVIESVNGVHHFRVLPDITNPVYFQGKPIRNAVALRNGDLLRIGSADPGLMVTIEYLAAGLAREAPPIEFGENNRVQIGRDPANDVVLPSPTVSRFHAVVERVGQRYRVKDLRSANGTFVNDQLIEGEAWLKAGDSIRIGPHRFILGQEQLAQVEQAQGMRVEALSLNKWVRKDLNLLKDISLVFEPREFIVVVGQSGGGKSTLLDAIAGFRPATHGRVLVNDTDIYRNFDAIRNEIGFVPQKDIIHMELTVYQGLDYAAQLRMPADTSPEERHERVMEVLQDLDLTHRKDVQISGLSGGQQKRVSIGVELLTKPGLFFLDEPTSGLDPGTETALMHLMRHLADQGRTIVLITHATKNVMLADKVVFLARGGYVAWFGPPDEALLYFDQYRSERDRHARSMEFDEIYAILDDSSKGKAEEWAERYRRHPAYQENIVRPFQQLGRSLPGLAPGTPAVSVPANLPVSKPHTKKVSGLRQFIILSARNLKILLRDRSSLVLMLISAPLVAMLDVLLSAVLGRDLFSFTNGSMANAITSLYNPVLFAMLIGALSQMREFVKESEIYRRERLVNLKVLPYVLSKIWVAVLMALYQGACYTLVHSLAFDMPGGALDLGIFYICLVLATLGGMMLGLVSSALAPNANSAPLIVIMLIIPQIVLGGALIPVPPSISSVTLSRWAFEGLMISGGAGSDVAADVCWALDEEVRDEMSLDDKLAQGCKCMGPNVLREESCNFPGLAKFYDPALDEPEPVEPADIGEPPPEPELPPEPAEPADPNDRIAVAQYLQALQDYQDQVKKIQDDYKSQLDDYQARADIYEQEMTDYQERRTEWELDRNAAVGKAEGIIDTFYTDYGWTFADKDDSEIYWARLGFTWAMLGVMIVIFFFLILFFIYRKDRTK